MTTAIMVEVFKTNVCDRQKANRIIDLIHQTYSFYKANFDLDDVDNILRIASTRGFIDTGNLVDLLKNYDVHAEVLPDE